MMPYQSRLSLLVIIMIAISSKLFASGTDNRSFRMPAMVTEEDYRHGKVVFRLNPGLRSVSNTNDIDDSGLRVIFSSIPGIRIAKKFPSHEAPSSAVNRYGQKLTDLSLIYEATFDPLMPVEKVCNMLLRSENIVYAEPLYIPKPVYNPNDPDTASQYYLGLIQAYAAWDISKGDTNIVVGVTDTGTDLDHPDLVNGIRYNYADPINGLDDDNDGYTDNFMGWDLGDGDNDPSVDVVHGSFVCGFAGASTDNAIGMAGPGFNTRFLPVKISSGGVLTAAYAGIVYAADHGCQVINCSWGGFGGGQYGQDIVDYATINKNRLVIGAAGNSDNENPFYPASYNYVLSVTGTNDTDTKWVNSSYGAFVDMSAPGEDVYSTIFDDTYSTSSGTSFAAPIVAAGAGLVMAHLPSLSPLQVAEQLRVTSDTSIYQVPGNAAYDKKLGTGRLNLFRALTESPKSVRFSDVYITDNNDDAFAEDDTLDISGLFTNYLAPLANLSVSLTCDNPLISVVSGNVNPGAMASMATYDNTPNPFRVAIGPGIPFNTKVTFTLSYSDGTYTDWQIFDLVVNVDYINVLVNDIGVSITSKGRIGYNEGGQNQGIGFTYNNSSSLLFDGCFMAGVDTNRVSDHTFSVPPTTLDDDFLSVINVRKIIPTVKSDFDLDSRFNDNGAGATKLPVEVNQRTYAWSTPADSRYVIVEYVIHNTGSAALQDFHAGLYCDWDLGNAVDNRADYDAVQRMGYVFSTASTNAYAGIKQLTFGPVNYYALENDGSSGSAGIYNGFTEEEKYITMSTQRPAAGQSGNGGDVSMTMASGPHTINPGDSVIIAYALIGGTSLSSLQSSANAADLKYNAISNLPENGSAADMLHPLYPVPASGVLNIGFDLGGRSDVDLSIYDMTGKLVDQLYRQTIPSGSHNIPYDTRQISNGVYIIRMTAGDTVISRKLVVSN